MERGKTRVTKLLLGLVLNFIGWKSGASFLEQSHNEIKQMQSNPKLPWTLKLRQSVQSVQ